MLEEEKVEEVITSDNVNDVLPDDGEEDDSESAELEAEATQPDSESEDEEEDAEEPTEVAQPDPEPVKAKEEGQDDGVEIEGVKYTKEEIDRIFTVGKSVYGYQKEHPGYDPILIHKDYTKKAQELAEMKRSAQSPAPQGPAAQPAPQPQPKPDLSKFRKEDVEMFEQMASALGFVKNEEIEKREMISRQRTYEEVKQQELNKFLQAHPEYDTPNDPENIRWGALLAEYNLYKLPGDPREVGKLLERAHRAVSGAAPTVDSKRLIDIIAKKKAANSGTSSVGGASGSQSKAPGPKSKKMERLSSAAKAGALSGFSKEELEEMFG